MAIHASGRRIALATACLGASVSVGMLASVYTTAGMDRFYARLPGSAAEMPGSAEIADSADAPSQAFATHRMSSRGAPPETLAFPPIPASR